jgi:hypothetical protein
VVLDKLLFFLQRNLAESLAGLQLVYNLLCVS